LLRTDTERCVVLSTRVPDSAAVERGSREALDRWSDVKVVD